MSVDIAPQLDRYGCAAAACLVKRSGLMGECFLIGIKKNHLHKWHKLHWWEKLSHQHNTAHTNACVGVTYVAQGGGIFTPLSDTSFANVGAV